MISPTDVLQQKVTLDFGLWEYACECGCGLVNPHPALAMGNQQIRDLLGRVVTISGPCRCHEHNARPATEVNERGVRGAAGARHSFHLPRADMAGYCCASDLQSAASLWDMFAFAEMVEWFKYGGISPYVRGSVSWLHVDVRGVTRLHQPWRQGYIDGRAVSIEAALMEDERRRALKAKEQMA